MKRLISAILSAVILLSAFPIIAVAADVGKTKLTEFEDENVYYSFDNSSKTLTISGEGKYTTDCGDNISSGEGGLKFASFSEFYDFRKKTEKVVIENGITVLGGATFAHFENLISVQLPETLEKIEPYAFYNCYSLQSITLPNSLKSIGFEAFRSCRSIKELNISKGVREISDNFILDTVNLEKITVDSENAYFTAENNVLYNKDKTRLIAVAPKQTEVTIPKTVSKISDLAFALSSIKSIFIPNTITDLGAGTFYKSDLEKITFQKQAQIKSIIKFSTYYGDDSAEYYGTFEQCKNLKKLIIPDSVETLSDMTIEGCKALEYLYIGKNVQYTGFFSNNGFCDCKSLNKIKVHKDNKFWFTKNGALYSKNKLRKKEIIELRFVPVNKKTFTVAKNTAMICSFAFANSKAEKITISKSVTSINNSAFYNCQNLKALNFQKPSKLKTLGYENDGDYYDTCCYKKPDYYYFSMFYNCKKLKRVRFPDSLETTYYPLFEKCKNLKSLYYGKSFNPLKEYIQYYEYFDLAIKNCKSLNKITFSSENKYYSTVNGVVCSKDKSSLYYYPPAKKGKNYTVPADVDIGYSTFRQSRYLKAVKILNTSKKEKYSLFGEHSFNKNITVLVKKNSFAHKNAKTNKIKYKFY